MQAEHRLERALAHALGHNSADCPPQLAIAMREAVLAGGARLRPKLCLAVAGVDIYDASASSEDAWLVASAIEIVHGASLVHDDLPCFDDASTRRGRPTIHARFGEASAVLVGDALIMTAFAQVSRLTGRHAGPIGQELAHAARRMVWGQALESEPGADLSRYHGHKTAALFEAAAVCGAWLAAQTASELQPDIEAWRSLGRQVGSLYQMADDILDVACAEHAGAASKSAGRDVALGRPNAAVQMGLSQARAALELRLQQARRAIVPGPRGAGARAWFTAFARRLSQLPGLWQDLPPKRCFVTDAAHAPHSAAATAFAPGTAAS